MSQRRSYSNSNDFNMDDLFRPEPDAAQAPQAPQQQPGPEYLSPPPQAPQQAPHQQAPQQYAPQPPQADQAPETQYFPPYPTGNPAQGGQPSYGGQQQYAQPQPSYGGQQSFGGQQTFGGQQQYGAPQQPYGAPPAPPAYAPAGQGYGPEDGGPRSNTKLIVGGVVAGVVAAGILVAVLMSGDPATGGTPKAKNTAVAKGGSTAPSSTGSGAASVSPEMQAQAKSLGELLDTANASRQAVISAVASVKRCEKLPDAQQALTQAAAQRDGLVTKLNALKVDQLPSGGQLVEQLVKGWQASATADREYAGYATDAIAACDPNKASSDHLSKADAASGQASEAKSQASTLWNAVAAQTGLATKGPTEL
ncbi:hypothetical protein [Kitasatospora sp. McL0602]|uniref:hypothetical protein n=1 Tax=Kitasatospora sp. McL0602 TaxID=3439530 RepID=UPI003F89473E